MTESRRNNPQDQESGPPPRIPEGPPVRSPDDHSFLLQAMFEVQKSVGQMSQAITTLQDEFKEQRGKLDSLRYTVGVSVAVVTLIVFFLGWLMTTFKEEILQAVRSSGL